MPFILSLADSLEYFIRELYNDMRERERSVITQFNMLYEFGGIYGCICGGSNTTNPTKPNSIFMSIASIVLRKIKYALSLAERFQGHTLNDEPHSDACFAF